MSSNKWIRNNTSVRLVSSLGIICYLGNNINNNNNNDDDQKMNNDDTKNEARYYLLHSINNEINCTKKMMPSSSLWDFSLIFPMPTKTLLEATSSTTTTTTTTTTQSPFHNSIMDNKKTSAAEATTSTTTITKDKPNKTIVYDFVIIGNGNAGQSAVQVLQSNCPKATVAVIDPLRFTTAKNNKNIKSSTTTSTTTTTNIHYVPDSVHRFDPNTQTVQLLNNTCTTIQYTHGILVATGVRGAPPPPELFDKQSLQRVLELRSTELAVTTKTTKCSKRRPMQPPESIRNKIIQAAINGEKIGIVGSGWEAIDLAHLITQKSKLHPTLVFANPGPLWNILPSYLSQELKRRLKKKGILIYERSYFRYMSSTTSVNTKAKNKSRALELHTAKTYDLLDTQRSAIDWLVVAPDITGSKGSATLATNETPKHMLESSDGRPWYKTWAELTKSSPIDPSIIVCFEDDGRIVVNAELCAASKVYAAGSVAKFPNSSTGHASVAGEGIYNGKEAGRVAAYNMCQNFVIQQQQQNQQKQLSLSINNDYKIKSFTSLLYSIPVWRSDLATFTNNNNNYGGKPISTSLSALGVQVLCVGHVDSERQTTRGFWWTNSSAQRRIEKLLQYEQQQHDDNNNNKEKIIISKQGNQILKQRKTMKKKGFTTSPIYGIGVVYYLDKVGRICGIMTWGLPFTTTTTTNNNNNNNNNNNIASQHVKKSNNNNNMLHNYNNDLNMALVDRMKHVIATNGGISAVDSQDNYHIMNDFLARETQRLVALALRGQLSTTSTGTTHGLNGPIASFSKPLYKYTEPTKKNSSSLNVLKRKDGVAMGILGEDLYARDVIDEEYFKKYNQQNNDDNNNNNNNNDATPNNLPSMVMPIAPIMPTNFTPTTTTPNGTPTAESLAELNRYLAIQKGWDDNDNRARPGKEDPIWLRPSDEKKKISTKQMIIDMYKQLLYGTG